MDCWLIASLQTLIKTVHVEIGENYKLYNVAPPLVSYLEQITNWYRRNVFSAPLCTNDDLFTKTGSGQT
eukprot:COSAG06_NODE_1364_length_9696_cov_14.104929_5_plen_69_part_00